MYAAAEENDVAGLTRALELGSSTEEIGPFGFSALQEAAKNGYFDVVETLLHWGANTQERRSSSALHLAAYNGFVDVVRLLLHVIDINDIKHDSSNEDPPKVEPPLNAAARADDDTVFRMLLAHPRIDLSVRAVPSGETPLHIAAKRDKTEMARLLLAHRKRVDPNAISNQCEEEGYTPLLTAARYGSTGVMRMLLDNSRVDVSARNSDCGHSALHQATLNNNVEIVTMLLSDPRFDINAVSNVRDTPLIVGAVHDAFEAVSLLLADSRVDVCRTDIDGLSALHFALSSKSASRTAALLLADPRVDVNQAAGAVRWSPLHKTASTNNVPAVELLLAHAHINPNARDSLYRTPLHVAAMKGSDAVVRALLCDRRVDVNAKCNQGLTALAMAWDGGHVNAAAALEADQRVRR